MNKKPNKWVAAVMGLVHQPMSMLYVAQPTWAAVYFLDLWMISRQNYQTPWPMAVGIALQVAIGVGGAIHAYRLAVAYPDDKPRPAYSRGPVVVGIVVGWIALAVGFLYFLEWGTQALSPSGWKGI